MVSTENRKKTPESEKMLEEQLKDAVNQALESDLSVRGFANLAGVSHSQLSYWLTGKRSINLATAGKIAEVLGMKLTVPKKPAAKKRASKY
jgi:transcriptional regulator with XRE-family HTH domain